jgi:hypothetical protein
MEQLVPRSIGEVLSDAAALLRRNLRAFVLVTLPFCAAELAAREAGMTLLGATLKEVAVAGTNGDFDPAVLFGSRTLVGAACLLASLVTAQILGAGLVGLAARAFVGERAPPPRSMFARGPAVLVTLLAWLVGMAAGTTAAYLAPAAAALAELWIIAIVAGLLAIAVSVVAVVVLGLRWALWPQAVVLEGRAGPRALARSTALMASRGEPFFEGAKFRLSVLYLVYFGVASTLQSLFMIPRVAVALAAGTLMEGPPPLSTLPLVMLVPLAFLEVVTNSLVIPYASVMTTVFYYDARVRGEGFDVDDDAPT